MPPNSIAVIGIRFPARSTIVRCRILGPLEAEVEGGPVQLGPPKQRALLGMLLLHGGQTVSTATLEEALWGEDPPRTAAHSIQTYVSGLRRALGDDLIVTTPAGYRVELAGSSLDAAEFEELAAASAKAETDPQQILDTAARALYFWRGEPLADVELTQTAHGRLHRLSEMRLQTIERWAVASLHLGRHDELVVELERLTHEHPLRESLWGLRMRSLQASGRVAEALRVYQELREVIGEQLGIEPSAEIQRLEEAILLGEPLPAQADRTSAGHTRNPFKGLRPFVEADRPDFFGRDHLIRELVDAAADPGRTLVAVVGPSGSGKSSVVRAGLVPALRDAALPGSDQWMFVVAQPGQHPFEEVRAAVVTAAGGVDPGGELTYVLGSVCDDLHRAGGRLVLVIDQFEEVFTAGDIETTTGFLDVLASAVRHPGLRLVVTLRADYYDRPMLHPEFGKAFVGGVVHVHPLTATELAAAASGPAAGVGIDLEPLLVSELVCDLAASPGALPLFQYALTEVFDRREGGTLTLNAYRAIGGANAALSTRAEDVYERLGPEGKEAARQILLRMVGVGEGDRTARRRVTMGELGSLPLVGSGLEEMLDRFGRYRLVSFDRDPVTGEPTVEVAHEALLEAWPRLRTWIEEGRADLRRRASLAVTRDEWVDSGHDDGYLLSSSRLDQYEEWARQATVALTTSERGFLEASLRARDSQVEAERQRLADERHRRRRDVIRAWSLASIPALALVVVGAIALFRSDPPEIAAMVAAGGDRGFVDLMEVGFASAEREFGIQIERIEPLIDPAENIARLCAAGTDLIALAIDWQDYLPVIATQCDDTRLVGIDFPPGSSELVPEGTEFSYSTFDSREGSFLAGAAAALKTGTGVVGFVGGMRMGVIEEFLTGFQDGVAAIDDSVEVRVVWLNSFAQPSLGRAAGAALIEAGADVVYHAAGATGDGVLEAVTTANTESADPVWFIGVDVDEALTAPPASRPYVLTSMVKRLDTAIVDAVGTVINDDFVAGELVYDLANDGVGLATTDGHIDDIRPALDELEAALARGEVTFAGKSVELTLDGPGATHYGSLTLDGEVCAFDGPTRLTEGDVIRVVGPSNPEAYGLIYVKVAAGTPFVSTPIPREETPPEVDLDTAAVAGGPDVPRSLTIPAFPGLWWVGCILGDSMIPAAAIEVSAAG